MLQGLVSEGLVTRSDVEGALTVARRRRVFVEELLIEMEAITEADLLQYQANFYETQFLSTQKLASASIDKAALRLVPEKTAEHLWVFPVQFDQRTQSLKVLMVQPDDIEVLHQVQFAARVHKVRPLVARPSAIKAAIQKHYQGKSGAFSGIAALGSGVQTAMDQAGLIDMYDKVVISDAPQASSLSPSQPDSMEGLIERPVVSHRPAPPQIPDDARRRVPKPVPMPAPVDSGAPPHHAVPPPASQPQPPPQPQPTASGRPVGSLFSNQGVLETLNVLVALLENGRGELRGHSVLVARICGRVCERLGLAQPEADCIVTAAYLHDIGKASTYHLTALNVAEYQGHRAQAQKSYLTPVRMLESARLPDGTIRALTHMYERFDGTGFPDRKSGKAIDLGARVIAMVETYADLTANTRNPFRNKLSPQEAWDVLSEFKGQVFDPALVDIFKLVVLGDDLRAKLLAGSRRALLVDPDPEETTVLELRLVEKGFDVTIARNSADVLRVLESNEFDVVISEVDLQPLDGFALLEKVRSLDGDEIPFVFLTQRTEGDMVQRGFELGANDYITKPASADVVALKIRQVLESTKRAGKGRGVSGSLEEMGLPDVVQVLFFGRKTGKLTIISGTQRGEVLFGEGHIFDAAFGDKRREEAFYAMLTIKSGHFELDPNFRPAERLIEASPESLLLEGMRRLDEANR